MTCYLKLGELFVLSCNFYRYCLKLSSSTSLAAIVPSALGKGLRKYVFDLFELPIILRYVQDNSLLIYFILDGINVKKPIRVQVTWPVLNQKALDGHEEYPWVVVVHEASKEGTKHELVPFVVN